MIDLRTGDCLDVLRTMPADSVDACVTDPPYGLTQNKRGGSGEASINLESPYGRARIGTGNGSGGFMGMKWDASVPSVEIWREVWRVLKPGAHLLAFFGTRTYHRGVIAIEDAGFEIRDQIAWVYGSGFPKSLDVSKSIDKRGGNATLTAEIGAAIKAARERRGVTIGDADARYCGGSTLWTWFEGRPAGQQMPTAEVLAAIAADWHELAPYAEATAEAERERLGSVDASRLAVAPGQANDRSATVVDITAPATDAAKQWDGWGTALKPALEPIVVARKPFGCTVAENVQRHGCGAINVDACRIDGEEIKAHGKGGIPCRHADAKPRDASRVLERPDGLGRWPANLIHDGSAEVVALFPADAGAAAPVTLRNGDKFRTAYGAFAGNTDEAGSTFHDDSGSAARFFYCAKASREDRNEGLDEFERGRSVDDDWISESRKGTEGGGIPSLQANIHPTVKPTDLMRYLCRLVTPPGGTVLDPFMGSGSTGKAAKLEDFRFIGIEREPQYVEIARARIEYVKTQTRLFA